MTTCSDCGQDHEHQRRDYPVGAIVVSLGTMLRTRGAVDIHPGDTGKVVHHCNDGRALVQFDKDESAHTFHYPEEYIKVVGYPAEWYEAQLTHLRADLARVTEERDAATLEAIRLNSLLELCQESHDTIKAETKRLRTALEEITAKFNFLEAYDNPEARELYVVSSRALEDGTASTSTPTTPSETDSSAESGQISTSRE